MTLNGDGTLARPATNDQIIIICLTHASMRIAILYFEMILTQTKTLNQKLSFIYHYQVLGGASPLVGQISEIPR